MLPPKGHEANPTVISSCCATECEKMAGSWEKSREIMVQQLFEKPKQQCLKFLADYALTKQHFVTGMKPEQRATTFKRDGRHIEWQEEFKTRKV